MHQPKPNPSRSRRPKGERTRDGILGTAVDLASLEGLEGLTIGRLANELGMSKSGLFAHFGSKEELQLAMVAKARQIFEEWVIRPALVRPVGMPRLWALFERWFGHVEEKVVAGGCFFTPASFEFDSRPGPVREAIVEAMSEWLSTLSRAIREAQKAGHLSKELDPARFALENYSMAVGGYWALELLGQRNALDNAREAIFKRLRTEGGPAGGRSLDAIALGDRSAAGLPSRRRVISRPAKGRSKTRSQQEGR